MKPEELALYIDHTLLAANASESKIDQLCKEAYQYHFASVCVNSCWTARCYQHLKGSPVNVCTVVGFPLGAMKSESKAFEASQAISDGAKEIDMVINVGALKDKKYDFILEDIKKVKASCGDKAILKVIIEACLLTDEEKVKVCELSKEAGADFVKTSTGFSTGGATVEDVKLMRQTVGSEIGVKASGGIRDRKTAEAMVEAGASRLGTSATVEIIK